MNTRPTIATDGQSIAGAVTAERLALCDALETLAPDDWQVQSLCPRWTVHDVVAHLTLATRDTVWGLVKAAIRARGNFDRMNSDLARAQSARFAPPALIEQLRETAASTRRAPLSSPLDPLVDVLVHAQDIVRPLGRTHAMPPGHVVPALTHAVNSRWYGGIKRFSDVTLIATDIDWTTGNGTGEVRGTAGDLLMMATGRVADLTRLSGRGVEVLATRLRST